MAATACPAATANMAPAPRGTEPASYISSVNCVLPLQWISEDEHTQSFTVVILGPRCIRLSTGVLVSHHWVKLYLQSPDSIKVIESQQIGTILNEDSNQPIDFSGAAADFCHHKYPSR